MSLATKDALKVVEALDTLAAFLGLEPHTAGAYLAFFSDERTAKLNEAIRLHNEFREAPIVERGRMLGITITECDGGYSAETVLSEEEE